MKRAPLLAAGLVALTALSAGAQPTQRLDRAQGESVRRMIREGDAVRFYCRPCGDVVFTAATAATRELQPFGSGFRLALNGEIVDPAVVYIDSGFGDGWENLAALLGLVGERAADKLPTVLLADSELHPFTGFYIGTLGEARVQISLHVRDRRLVGTFLDEEDGGRPTLRLLATSFRTPRGAATVKLLERDADDQIRGTLTGHFDAGSGALTGTWASLDGAARPLSLTRVADYVTRTQLRAGLRTDVLYPRFRAVPAQVLNARFEAAAEQAEREFLAEWTPQAPSGGEVWWQRGELTLAFYRPDLVSLWREARWFTGGVHGGLAVGAENYVQQGSAFVPFALPDGFRPGAPFHERLSASVLEELRRRKVDWAATGQVRRLDAPSLAAFTVSSRGLTIALPPRAEVELWSKQALTATVPFSRLRELIDPSGPLARLVSP